MESTYLTSKSITELSPITKTKLGFEKDGRLCGHCKRTREALGFEAESWERIGISKERLEPLMPYLRNYISFWREYPDLFVDYMVKGTREEFKDSDFQLFYYQRVFLRVAMRYKYVYAVFPRAYSKSFLAVLVLMIKCILYPHSRLFVVSGGKEYIIMLVSFELLENLT